MEPNTDTKNFFVRISICFNGGGPIDEVVYWRYGLPLELFNRYMWYYEYLAAKLKVKNPHRDVFLDYGYCTYPCGQDYIDINLERRLSSQRKRLKGLLNPDKYYDLFGFISSEKKAKAEKVQADIEKMEHGIYDHYVPPTYINKIKQWI